MPGKGMSLCVLGHAQKRTPLFFIYFLSESPRGFRHEQMTTGGTTYVYLAHVTLLTRRKKENFNSNHKVISQPTYESHQTQRQKDVQK